MSELSQVVSWGSVLDVSIFIFSASISLLILAKALHMVSLTGRHWVEIEKEGKASE